VSRKLIDNNIWAAHEMDYPDAVSYINQCIENEDTLIINTVVQMELMSHFEIETDPEVKEGREEYINLMADEIIQIDQRIAMKAGEIRRKAKLEGRKVPKGPDALIAATAIVLNLELVSNNDGDFVWVSSQFGFKLTNPIEDNVLYKVFQEKYKKNRG
jgi:predicted nucleic acid-binding protein